jgi:uncharacterized BrkB/YihY/UPF0761 family membrane protein
MDALDIFALIVILLLLAVVIWLVVLLGSWPGKIARERNHPQADAITALGWIGIITMGVSWLVAIVWAYYIPSSEKHSADLSKRIESLENQLHEIRAGGGET